MRNMVTRTFVDPRPWKCERMIGRGFPLRDFEWVGMKGRINEAWPRLFGPESRMLSSAHEVNLKGRLNIVREEETVILNNL